MAGTTVVMVLDQDDPRRGEIKILGDSSEAAHLAEDLIESGVEVERIRIFDATELSMRVVHKPIVSLGAEEFENSEPVPSEEMEPVAVYGGGPGGDTVAVEDGVSQDERADEEQWVRNGVRFSSLFKSDDV